MSRHPYTTLAPGCTGMLALCATLAVSATLASQDLGHKAPPQRRPIVIENATIHVGDGRVVAGGTLWFEDGRIAGVEGTSATAALIPDAERIDARGLHVYPGMVSAFTTLGLSEIGSVPATIDVTETGELTPEVHAAVAVNPDSTAIPVARSNGVLAAGVVPSGGLLPGRVSVIQLEGWTHEDMTVAADVGPVVEWPALPAPTRARRSRGRDEERRGDDDPQKKAREDRERIDDAFRAARAYGDARGADPSIAQDLRHDALLPALRGEVPVFVRADAVEQIVSAVSWALDLGLRPVILGGADAMQCLDFLREHAVPIVVLGTHRLPSRRDSDVFEPFVLPAALESAGLTWCLATTGGASNERNLPYHAATAVAHGLPVDAALRAVTLAPARILGVGDRLGSLEPGKLATLIVTDGNPLETTTQVRFAFVAGRRVDLANKQTELAEKYREKYRQLGLWPEKGR